MDIGDFCCSESSGRARYHTGRPTRLAGSELCIGRPRRCLDSELSPAPERENFEKSMKVFRSWGGRACPTFGDSCSGTVSTVGGWGCPLPGAYPCICPRRFVRTGVPLFACRVPYGWRQVYKQALAMGVCLLLRGSCSDCFSTGF